MACAHHMISCIKFKVQETYEVSQGHQVRVRRVSGPPVQPPVLGRWPLPQEPLQVQDISNALFFFISFNKALKETGISIVMVLS